MKTRVARLSDGCCGPEATLVIFRPLFNPIVILVACEVGTPFQPFLEQDEGGGDRGGVGDGKEG